MKIRPQRRFAGKILLIFSHVKLPAGFLLAIVYPR